MRRILIALVLSVLLLPLSASTALAESSVMLSESRVDPMDLDNDGEIDMLRVIYAVNASSASNAGIQVVAETGLQTPWCRPKSARRMPFSHRRVRRARRATRNHFQALWEPFSVDPS